MNMRVYFAAAAIAAFGHGALANGVPCVQVEAITSAANAASQVASGMMRWCIDNGPTQPACLKLNELSKENGVSRKSVDALPAILEAGAVCSNRRDE